jgi:hypothetical protein
VERLNQLILAYNTHTHQVAAVPSTPPSNAGVTLPVTPAT